MTIPNAANPLPALDGAMLHNLALFGETLRRLGLDFGSGNFLDLTRAAAEFAPLGGNREDFRQAAQCLLVHRKADLPLFDEAFRVFWRRPASGQTSMDLRSMGEQRRYRQPQVGPPPRLDASDAGAGDAQGSEPQPVVDLSRSYSQREALRSKDFADFTPAEMAAARRMMAELAWDVGRRRARRLTPGAGQLVDWRRTLRQALKYGGEALELAYRRPLEKPRPLVLLCDISGSMEQYTRMLLHFIHSMAGEWGRVEAFLFATRLTRVTRHLRYRSVDQAVAEVARAVPDWAGGTRIGESIKAFNYRWARRVLRGGAVTLIISDGWDRGEPELLSRELARLQRSCHRLIWLNPLLGGTDYQPVTQGMRAALPYVDDFLPVHNLNSLEALARHLNQLGQTTRRPPALRRVLQAAREPTGVVPVLSPSQQRQRLNPALASLFQIPGRKGQS